MATSSSSSGASMIVVVMIAALSLVVGALLGVGGLLGYLKSDPANATSMGIGESSKDSKGDEKAECEPCKESSAGAVYGLAYPLEETLIIEGDLDAKFLREYVIKRRLEFQKCYQERLGEDPNVKGEMKLQFTINANGSVAVAVSRANTTGDKALEKCVLGIIKEFDFKERVKAMTVVKVDVVFAPLGGAP